MIVIDEFLAPGLKLTACGRIKINDIKANRVQIFF